jgi:hypothetical protein
LLPGTATLANHIYLWPADGGDVLDYPPDETGLGAAITAAVSGDTIWLPSIEIALTAGITLVAGSILRGISQGSILNFSGFSGTAIAMAENAICDHFHFDFTPSGNDSIGLDARFSGAIVNHVRGYILGATTGGVALRVGA